MLAQLGVFLKMLYKCIYKYFVTNNALFRFTKLKNYMSHLKNDSRFINIMLKSIILYFMF